MLVYTMNTEQTNLDNAISKTFKATSNPAYNAVPSNAEFTVKAKNEPEGPFGDRSWEFEIDGETVKVEEKQGRKVIEESEEVGQ